MNGKVYVGQTKDVCKRKLGHLYSARVGNKRPLYSAIRKHGWDNFTLEILEECPVVSVNAREVHWINTYDSLDPLKGYNLARGGNCPAGYVLSAEHKRKLSLLHKGRKRSPEHCKKISERAMGNSHRLGKTLTEEQKQHQSAIKNELYASEEGTRIRQKISKTLTGRTLTEEHKKNVGLAGIGKKRSDETRQKMSSHVKTDEHRRKLSEAAKRRAYPKKENVES